MITDHKDIVYLIIIVGRKNSSPLLASVYEFGGRGIHTVYGKGSVKASYLQYAFGLVPEDNKLVITCLLPKDKSDGMLKMLINKYDFNKPNTGIAFTIPIEELTH